MGPADGEGGDVRAFSTDARKETEVQRLFALIEDTVGPIEACLCNAGSNVNKPLRETTERLFFKVWELGCYAGFLVGREAARHMLKRGRGTTLFTGAIASVRGARGIAAFAAAKFGLRAVAQSMARELGPNNIHVVHLLIDAGVDSAAIHMRMTGRELLEHSPRFAGIAPRHADPVAAPGKPARHGCTDRITRADQKGDTAVRVHRTTSHQWFLFDTLDG